VSTVEIGEIAGALLAALALVLLYWLIRRSNVRSTKLGIFVERERYDDEPPEEPWPYADPDRTIEYPPKKEDK
jgi:hypothetical protein